MSSPRNKSGLELDEDIQQQEKVWVIEKISRAVMALIILAALLGLLGHGPLSSKTLVDSASGLVVQYERFEHRNATTVFRIHLTPSEQTDDQTRLSIGQEFLGHVEVSAIEPEPLEVELWPDHVTYIFNRPDRASPADIIIHYQPIDFGRVHVVIGLDGWQQQTFSQFVYP